MKNNIHIYCAYILSNVICWQGYKIEVFKNVLLNNIKEYRVSCARKQTDLYVCVINGQTIFNESYNFKVSKNAL